MGRLNLRHLYPEKDPLPESTMKLLAYRYTHGSGWVDKPLVEDRLTYCFTAHLEAITNQRSALT